MILLLGATGYFGQAFATELRRRGKCFIPLSRSALDYAHFELLFDYVRKIKPDFVINAEGVRDPLELDASDKVRLETFQANTLLPQTISRVCLMTNTPWGHVSSGCVFSGAKVLDNGTMRVERDLMRTEVRRLFDSHPEKFFGFTELDEPNLSFRSPPCSFAEGTRALAEEALRGWEQTYIWRPGIAFSECDDPSNLLSILQTRSRIYDRVASVAHLQEFVRACLQLHECEASFGVYNVSNRGAVTMRQIVGLIRRVLKPSGRFAFWDGDDAARGSSFILDQTKLQQTGVKMRPVEEALEDALKNWQPARPMDRLSAGRSERAGVPASP